jgi:Fe2+ or Zn2+ uptake regulation protein
MSSERKRTRPLPRTPVALSVLNLLAERPMHPYEMRVLMRQRHHDRAFQIRESSVYDTVARLADRGLIEPVEVSACSPTSTPCTTPSRRRGRWQRDRCSPAPSASASW